MPTVNNNVIVHLTLVKRIELMLSELTTIKQNYFAKKATSGEEESEAGVSGTLVQVGCR